MYISLPSTTPSLRREDGWSTRPPLCFLVGRGLWLGFMTEVLLSEENGLAGLGFWEKDCILPKKRE